MGLPQLGSNQKLTKNIIKAMMNHDAVLKEGLQSDFSSFLLLLISEYENDVNGQKKSIVTDHVGFHDILKDSKKAKKTSKVFVLHNEVITRKGKVK